MKMTPKLILGAVLCFAVAALIWFSGWVPVLWSTGTHLLPDDVGVGYYRDFHIARKAIEQSSCAESIEYSRHEDLTLEDFHFQIRTQSGWIVRLWFHEGMDVEKVCSEPRGFAVVRPMSQLICQRYTTMELSTRLKEKGIKITNLNDVLCNLGELTLFFQANCNKEEPYLDTESNQYLYVEVLGQERAKDFLYSRLR
jgi:hypothetical protein